MFKTFIKFWKRNFLLNYHFLFSFIFIIVGIYWVFFGIAKADAFEWGFDATWFSLNYNYSCAIKTDWSGVCWGLNTDWQATFPSGTNYKYVSAWYKHTCAIKTDWSGVC